VRFAGQMPGEPAAQARDQYDAFFRKNHRELARLAYTLSGNQEDADDITGEALASVWEHWSRVQAADHPLGYVRKIIVNLAADRIRRTVRERHKVAGMAVLTRWFHTGPDIGAVVDLQAAVLALPPGRRACVVLRHVLDLPEDEVARTLGISRGTVKSQTSKGLAQLRTSLTDHPPDSVDSADSAPATEVTSEIRLNLRPGQQ
jgi:RNA polymerase sigma-70 factor (sigma-E family)